MKNKLAIALALLTIITTAIAIFGQPKAAFTPFSGPRNTPLVSLITNPERYEGKHVCVQGYVRLDSEWRALYLTKDDADYGIIENSVWIGGKSKDAASGAIESVKPGFAYVEGTFRMSTGTGKGQWGLWAGAITDITHLVKITKQH